MRSTWTQRFREWLCRRFGHRPYDDGNVMVCRCCHVLTGPREEDAA